MNPIPADLGPLIEKLRWVRQSASLKDKASQVPARRFRAVMALKEVVEALNAVPAVAADDLTADLGDLLAALADLEAGTLSPMLEASKRAGSPPMSSIRQMVMAISAMMLDALERQSGLSRMDAAADVAKTLRSAGFALPTRRTQQSLAEVVIDWRDRLQRAHSEGAGLAERLREKRRRSASNKVPQFALDQWRVYKADVRDLPAEVYRGELSRWAARAS